MQGAVEQIGEWRKQVRVSVDQFWVHCNTHVNPTLAQTFEKALLSVEDTINLRKYAMEALNTGFFGANSSCMITIMYALSHMFRPSPNNQEWSQTKNFQLFLDTWSDYFWIQGTICKIPNHHASVNNISISIQHTKPRHIC